MSSAIFSGFWFWLWAKIAIKNFRLAGEERIWPGLGWFSGLVCVGSVAGAVAWAARMQVNTLLYEVTHKEAHLTARQKFLMYASSNRWYATFGIFYGVKLVCMIIPKLMLLGRLTENISGRSQARSADMDRARRWWHGGTEELRRRALPLLFRAMAAAVVLCSVVSTIAYFAASAYNVTSAVLFDEAAAACDNMGNETNASNAYSLATIPVGTNARNAISVQSISEAIALLVISFSYLILVLRSLGIYRRAETLASSTLVGLMDRGPQPTVQVPAAYATADYTGTADASIYLDRDTALGIVKDSKEAAVEQRRRLVAACAVVLITFPARAAFDLLRAYSTWQAPYNSACHQCDACQSEQFVIKTWLDYTPEFQPVVVALSSSFPLSISLWLMMSAWERRHLRSGGDINKTEEQRQAIAARARLGVDLPRPLREVLGN